MWRSWPWRALRLSRFSFLCLARMQLGFESYQERPNEHTRRTEKLWYVEWELSISLWQQNAESESVTGTVSCWILCGGQWTTYEATMCTVPSKSGKDCKVVTADVRRLWLVQYWSVVSTTEQWSAEY
jgi:hypothetical protein